MAAMASLRLRFGESSCWVLIAATLALVIAMLVPARSDAFGTFANGVLTVNGGEGKIVPRCAGDGEITVSGVFVDNGPAYCRDAPARRGRSRSQLAHQLRDHPLEGLGVLD